MAMTYDALLIVSFGGPEGPADVIPFLENVLRGRNVPRERMLEVAAHYDHFDGVSPINAQVRELIAALQLELDRSGIALPIYWGNRNWKPLLPDTLRQMAADGVQKGLAFFTSAYSSYSGCRQYRENVAAAQQEVGSQAPQIDKLRAFFNHPGFVAANAERLRDAMAKIPESSRATAPVLFTAHSIPFSMARGCRYEAQLRETCRLVSEAAGVSDSRWQLVYQSRSGRPEDPWLEPDILDSLRELHRRGERNVVVAPVGFLSDHMEVMYDLDYEALHLCEELGMHFVRAGTVGTHPAFVTMIRELIEERMSACGERPALGLLPASHDVCPVDCCPAPARPMRPVAPPAS